MRLSLGIASLWMFLTLSGADDGGPITQEAIVQRAMAEASAISDPADRAEALIRLANAQLERNELAASRATARLARDAAKAMDPHSPPVVPHPIIKVAQVQARAGDRLAARQTFNLATRTIQSENQDRQLDDWVNLISIQRDAMGRAAMAETLKAYREYLEKQPESKGPLGDAPSLIAAKIGDGDLSAALRQVRDLDRVPVANRANHQIAVLFEVLEIIGPGEAEAARPILEETRKRLDSVGGFERNTRLGSLAEICARLGLFEEAVATASAINLMGDEAMATTIAAFKAQALLETAQRQAKAGKGPGARVSARLALAVVNPIRGEGYLSYPLSRAAKILADVGDIDGARLALLSCRRPRDRVDILRWIGEAQARRDDPRGARQSFQKALTQAQQLLKEESEKPPAAGGNQATSSQQPGRTADLTGQIALIEILLGNLPGALTTIESSLNGQERDQAIVEIATDRAQTGDLKSATGLLEKIKSPKIRRQAWIAVACSLPTKTEKHTHLAD